MLKRLLFAVFVLGLVFSLSGTAISGIGKKPVEALNPINWSNPNAPLANDVTDARPATAEFKKPISEVREYQMSGTAPSVPQTYFCDLQYYYDDTVTAVWVWSIPDAYGDDLMNMRFTTEDGIECTLLIGWQMMLTAWTSGTPDFRMYLWDDDGFGFPGNKLDSVTILNADIGTGTWWWAEGTWPSTWVMGPGEEYHIGWTTLGGDGDTLWIASDKGAGPHSNNGEERASENWAGFWGTMLADWGDDVCFFIESERCCYELPYSDCYSQSWDEGVAFFWRAPHPDYDIIDYAQRFTVNGVETLSSVDLPVYDMGQVPPNVSGNDDIIIKIWDDDGAGFPGTVLATEIVTAGNYPLYPAFTNIDFYSHGLVFEGEDFFVSFGSSGIFPNDCEATLSDDDLTPNGRSYCVYGGDWWTLADLFDAPVDMNYTANLCKDPFVDCVYNSTYAGLAWFWRLPDVYGDVASAQQFKSVGQDCQIREVSWALYDPAADSLNNTYSENSVVSVHADAGGLPGAALASITLTPADYVLFPGMTTVDFTSLGVSVPEKYWVSIESFASTPETGIRTLSDAGGSGYVNGAAELWNGFWGYLNDDWGLGLPDVAFVAESYHCCIPFDKRTCDLKSGEGWTTYQHDQQRTGASFNSFSDAQCDLNVIWCYTHPLNNIWYTGPAISGDRIACAWNNEVQVLDLATGANIYTIAPGQPVMGGNVRCTPTIAGGVMYLSGGDQNSYSAWDFATGAMLWSRDISTVGIGGIFGNTRYSPALLLDQGGTLVLYWGTDGGAVVAVDAATGALYGGWGTNPVFLGASTLRSGSTDGSQLFYNTYLGVEGDVFAIDAATGDINWQLSSSGGLQAATVYPEGPQIGEGFPSAGSVDLETSALFLNSHIPLSFHPGDGVFYSIKTSDGSLNYAVPSIGNRNTADMAAPVVDRARVYVAGQSRWSVAPIGGPLLGFTKSSGAIAWVTSSPEYNSYRGDMALTCEEGAQADMLMTIGHHGFIDFRNSETGDEIFRRRVTYGGFPNSIALSAAIAPGYIAISDFYGTLSVLAKGDDRQRLELQTYQPELAVEFGDATSLHVPIPGALVNTGCADLTFCQLETNVAPNHPWIPPDFISANVRPDVMDRAASITDKLIEGFNVKAILANHNEEFDDFFVMRDRGEQMTNLGANAGVGFLQYANHTEAVVWPHAGDVLAAGDTADIMLDVNQSMILRGPQDFYMVICSDDPDFYLHDVCGGSLYGKPEIHVTIVGGCLIDTVHMAFGMGGGNTRMVTNTGRIGTGDWGANIDIDGDDASYYQGSYIWANGVFEQATHSQDWTSGGGEADAYWSMQPDPNWCDNECAPHMDPDVTLSCLGGYSEDGVNYEPIMGNRVCATYLDSMQNFDLGAGWAWDNWGAPFDNDLTMGLMCNSRTVGAVDFAPLKDVTVDIMEITERNGDPVDGFRIGTFIDYDVSGDDVAVRSASGKATYVSAGGVGDTQWGSIKVPFGCGDPTSGIGNSNVDYNSIGAAVTGAGNQWFWTSSYMGDSAWNLLNLAPGTYVSSTNGDRQTHFTIGGNDFAGGDTYELAVATYGLHGTSGDDTEPDALADLVNKWLGFGRGDVNNDGTIDLADVCCLARFVNGNGPGPIPFMHLGDVDVDGDVDMDDVVLIAEYLYNNGPCPGGDWCF